MGLSRLSTLKYSARDSTTRTIFSADSTTTACLPKEKFLENEPTCCSCIEP